MDQTPRTDIPGGADHPRGIHGARVDNKGRLKLPAAYQHYFRERAETRFFMTTLDKEHIYLYPLPAWKENEQILESVSGSEEAVENAEAILFTASNFGADADMDNDGRLLVPQKLRELFGVNDAPVWLRFEKGRLLIYNEAGYKRREQIYEENLPGRLRMMKTLGVK